MAIKKFEIPELLKDELKPRLRVRAVDTASAGE